MSAPDNFVLTDSTYDSFVVGIDGQNEFKVWQGLVGAHYTPYVDGVGNLSWTNNGELPNPPTVNVSGKGLTITGIAATTGDLPATANQFDCYLVGTSDPYYVYMYYENAWVNIGAVGKGEKGDQGFSPIVTVTPITGGHQISITDEEDTETFYVMDGSDGVGIPSGGQAGYVLAKRTNTSYDTEWIEVEAGGGTVQSVNEVLPEQNGNITLTADDIPLTNNVSVEDTIDQIETDMGDVSDLTTSATNCVDAINEVKTNLSTVKSDIGIVEDTNTATHTIAAGQYVIWKDALYKASQAIPLGTTLSLSNLTAVSNGGFNDLQNESGTWYCKMPDGTLIHYGEKYTDTAGTATVTGLSPAFISNPKITLTVDAWNPTAASTAGVGVDYFTIRGSASTTVQYIAIGRWK